MRRGTRNGANVFVIALAVLIGLLWAGAIGPEMKWTATMFGLALAAFLTGTGGQARHS